MSYRVELEAFSGPMDLLLHLVKRQEVSIHDISISEILRHFLTYLKALETLDLTRKQARLEFEDVRAEALGDPGAAAGALARTLDQASVLLAAESTGGAERCLDAAVEHARSRIQFGRPIGSFQAIKHKCADVLLEVESAKAAVYWGSWVADQDEEDLAQAASIAKSLASDAYLRAAAENVQIHGGIGVTWEADPQLYLKRAKTNEELLGSPTYHRVRITRGLGV